MVGAGEIIATPCKNCGGPLEITDEAFDMHRVECEECGAVYYG